MSGRWPDGYASPARPSPKSDGTTCSHETHRSGNPDGRSKNPEPKRRSRGRGRGSAMRFVEGREPLLRRLRVRGLLSFGPDTPEFEFSPLDVLIGANAAGKSNFLEAIRLLAPAPTDLAGAIRRGGGVGDWLWKGEGAASSAVLSAEVGPYPETGRMLRCDLEIAGGDDGRLVVSDERIEEAPSDGASAESSEERLLYGTVDGVPVLRATDRPEAGGWPEEGAQVGEPTLTMFPSQAATEQRERGQGLVRLRGDAIRPDESILSRQRDLELCPELSWLARQLGRIEIYGARPVGPESPVRRPQTAGLPGDRLFPDASNLASVWREIERRAPGRLDEQLRRFLPRWKRLSMRESGGKIECLFHEFGLETPMPATGAADGTIRFITLLAALLAPSPPSVLCLEHPEAGLHHDHLLQFGGLLADACERMQVLVTTHSEFLVSEFTTRPEAVIVCDRTENGTALRRLDAEVMEKWPDEGSLGDLWCMGALEGTS